MRTHMHVTVDDLDETFRTVVGLDGRETRDRHGYREGVSMFDLM
ncbi:hypothetical protein H7J76_25595 [Mycolicibacterium fortuitum]|jgi:hypothetical protein|uniref:Uncharacterized protein n=1 Tax=Mycolicibacterium fortuitum TaxID=1766 RepID=A0A378U852_MYCFO|nr:hypothetical protein [Mycolicibacterium fortuitum]NOR02098.1 hypothetical protein [Mycolicibacterium fortuitum]STZ72592.1 Uncharacterised protein [Mycolicibacterium fortuitum]